MDNLKFKLFNNKEKLYFLTQALEIAGEDVKKYMYDYFSENALFNVFGIIDGNILISFAVIFENAPDEFDILYISTNSKYRRMGFAKLLITNILSEYKSQLSRIFLEVRESNMRAINLYKAFGFKEISIRKNYYNDGETAINFRLDIKEQV